MKIDVQSVVSEPRVESLRFVEFVTLTKPRVVVLVALCALLGAISASGESVVVALLLHAALGTGLVAGGAAALNQYFERDVDARMPRTAARPLPSARLQPAEALAFGVVLSLSGLAYLAAYTNLLTAAVGLLSISLYLFAYTPMKRTTAWCIEVGAIAGALPPVMGWVAVRGTLDAGAIAVFAILYLWQLPHFIAIAWLYRDEYKRAGLQMSGRSGSSPARAVRTINLYNYALVASSLVPLILGLAGWGYAVAAVTLGIGCIAVGRRIGAGDMESYARRVFGASLIYLPVLYIALALTRTV